MVEESTNNCYKESNLSFERKNTWPNGEWSDQRDNVLKYFGKIFDNSDYKLRSHNFAAWIYAIIYLIYRSNFVSGIKKRIDSNSIYNQKHIRSNE